MAELDVLKPKDLTVLTTSNGSGQEDAQFASFSSSSSENSISENREIDAKSIQEKESKTFSFLLLSSHTVTRKQGKVYRCDVCSLTYRHVFSLKRHFLRNHVTKKYISQSDLNNCKITTKTERATDFDATSNSSASSAGKESQSVIEVSHDKTKDIVLIGLYRCHMCKSINYDTREEIREHYLKHPTKSRFTCEKCNVVFSNKQALYRHLTSHAGESSFPCTTCSEIFDSKTEYLKHAATHTDGRTCKYCFKILSTKANKCRHERIHEGLKPYPCKHCNLEFSQSADLKKHIRKQHAELYISCTLCTGLFSSKTALKKHLTDRHQVTKSRPSSPDVSVSLINDNLHDSSKKKQFVPSSSPSPSKKKPVIPPNEPHTSSEVVTHCTVCRKAYRSYIGMMHHRRKAHPFAQTGRKVHKKKKKYYTRSARQKAFGQGNSNEMSEEDFYKSISTSIAENLLNYVDGKTSQLSLRQYNFNDQIEQSVSMSSQQWSTYNFPNSFNVDQALHFKGKEVKYRTSEMNTTSEAALLNGFSTCGSYDDPTDYNDHDDMECSDIDEFPIFNCKKYEEYQNVDIEERKKLIGRQVDSVIICNVCKERILSRQAFEDHSVNNHPNVACSFIEIEGEKDSPPVVPEDMQRQFLSPVGVYFSCSVPPPVSEKSSICCTKCQITFSSIPELHEHILSCGGKEITRPHVPKTVPYKKIKRTMKKRINTAWVKKIKRKLNMCNTIPMAVTDITHPHDKEKSSLSESGVVSKLGKPKNNLKLLCRHCHQAFKTKSLLNNHINRCYKRLVMKSKCLNATMKKVKVIRKKPKKMKSSSSIMPEKEKLSQVNNSANLAAEVIKVPDLPQIEVPAERLSPSLEVLLKSIKDKLTAEELSPSNPTFSWMEDESFISVPNAAKNVTVTMEECADMPKGKRRSSTDIAEIAEAVKDSGHMKQQKRRKTSNVPLVNASKKTCIPELTSTERNDNSTDVISSSDITQSGTADELLNAAKQNNNFVAELVENQKEPVIVETGDVPAEIEQDIIPSVEPAQFYKKKNEDSLKVSNTASANLQQTTSQSHKPAIFIKKAVGKLSSKCKAAARKIMQKSAISGASLSSCGQSSKDMPVKNKDSQKKYLPINCNKDAPITIDAHINSVSQDNGQKSESSPITPLLSNPIQLKALRNKVASAVSTSIVDVGDCDDPLPVDATETKQDFNYEDILKTLKATSNKRKQKCPYCLQDFAYLTTFHRHISACEEKHVKKDLEDPQQPNMLNLLVLPKKDEVEESMISLLRHQSRQSKMMKEAQSNETVDVKNFQAYTCESCHKIFFSLFKLLQHRVVHKLQGTVDKDASLQSESHSSPSSNSDPPEATTASLDAIPGSSSASVTQETPVDILELPSNTEVQQPIENSSASERLADVSPEITNTEILEKSKSDLGSSISDVSSTTPAIDLPIKTDDDAQVKDTIQTDISVTQDTEEENPSLDVGIVDRKRSTSSPNLSESLMASTDVDDVVDPNAIESSTILPRIKKRKKMKTLVVRKRPLLFKKNMKERLKLKKDTEFSPVEIPEPLPTAEYDAFSTIDLSIESVVKYVAEEENVEEIIADVPMEESISPKLKSPLKKSKKSTSNNPADRSCPICGKVLASMGYLKRHILTRHSTFKSTYPKSADPKPKKLLVKNKLKKKKQKRNVLRRICKREVPLNTLFVKKHLLPFGKNKKQ